MGAVPAKQNNFMMKVAAAIVDRRNLIFLLIVIAIVFSVFSRNWVQVEDDLTAYLPADSATREGLDVMKDQFITYGSANFMVANISYEDAQVFRVSILTTLPNTITRLPPSFPLPLIIPRRMRPAWRCFLPFRTSCLVMTASFPPR